MKPRQPTRSVPMPETMSSAVGGHPLAVLSERVKRTGATMQAQCKPSDGRSITMSGCTCSRVGPTI